MYKINYLPLAQQDLINIASYLAEVLKAPKAAIDFIDAVEIGIKRLAEFPFSCRVYTPINKLETEYRMLQVKNYAVLYTIVEQTVEIHRVVFAKMDLTKVIN